MSKQKKIYKKKSATAEARFFVGSGSLRAVLEQHGSLSHEAIDKIVNACGFVFKG